MWEGEAEALAGAAEAGRRAALWMRALPVPEAGGRPERWIVGELADAVERAMGALNPEDCDRVGPDGEAIDGAGGVDAATMADLAGLPFALPGTPAWLSPDQQLRLLAVVASVTAAVRLLANDPGAAIIHGELSRMCAILTCAARPDGAAWTSAVQLGVDHRGERHAHVLPRRPLPMPQS
ncbi:hypothetical protein [Streptomyces anulatus]|uniref:hypothetical protein n=1 Tax=Streptomyces anulatus TaxID=1892 RepID=UPI002E8087BE|nr:hypothetical protein [Streptomyces anulatus]WUC92006.1 hypothetical protein OHQ35_38525 [Streptomyces anulatus]